MIIYVPRFRYGEPRLTRVEVDEKPKRRLHKSEPWFHTEHEALVWMVQQAREHERRCAYAEREARGMVDQLVLRLEQVGGP